MKIVFSVSSTGLLVSQAVRSLKSIRRFFDRNDIIVYYTPPRTRLDGFRLSRFAIVNEVANLTEPFTFMDERGDGRYGEKVNCCLTDDSEIVFLDADTLMRKDITPLLDGDFDFSARVCSGYEVARHDVWQGLCRRYARKTVPWPNSGFLIFKHSCHRRIFEQWLRYVNSDLSPNPHPTKNYKDEYALAFAVSAERIRWMTPFEHAFMWKRERGVDAYVLHGMPRYVSFLLEVCRCPWTLAKKWSGLRNSY